MSMRDKFLGLVTGAAVLGLLAALPSPLTAEEHCPRGTLDKLYCDRDGDQIADLPTDPADWVNPDTLIFAYTPVEDPAVYKSVWAGFIDHIAKVTGKKVLFFSVQSNAAQLEAMRSGRLHIAGFNTGSNPIAVSCAGFAPFAMMASLDGSFGYEMEIIVPADSDIMTPADIKGRTLTFTSPTSLPDMVSRWASSRGGRSMSTYSLSQDRGISMCQPYPSNTKPSSSGISFRRRPKNSWCSVLSSSKCLRTRSTNMSLSIRAIGFLPSACASS